MKRSLRKRYRSLVFPFLFVASLAFAYQVLIPAFPGFLGFRNSSGFPVQSTAPDSTGTVKQAATDSVYQNLLTKIGDLFNQEKYEECLVLLKKAQAMKPGVASVQERIIRVEGLIAQQKKTMEEYGRLIKMADDYFSKKDYLNAKSSYQLAIDVKPNDDYARGRLNETMNLLRSNKAQNILYDVTIAGADKLFAAQEYEKAKVQYQNASNILPGEAYPKEKINAIIKIQVDQQVREELFRQAITAADNFYASGSFQRSLLEYQKALQQKPAEPYPQQRIDELTKILADLAALEAAYKDAISRADQLFTSIRYKDARGAYEEALKLKQKEIYPANRIREIDGILARIAKENADFEMFVNTADSFYMDKNFIRARQNYQLALQIKPNESYPKAMLAKTMEGVGTQEANELAMEEAYKMAIASADKLLAEKALEEAKLEYRNALAIKPEESYPPQKIAEIDGLIAAAAAAQKQLDAQYQRVIENADRMVSDNLYPQAKEQYMAALALKPAETYPTEKIAELDAILANLEEQKAKDAQYKALITEANKLYSSKSYEPAKAEYQKALEIKPNEPLPAGRIRAIDSITTALATKEALDKQYADLIAVADEQLGRLDYQPAKATYLEAQALKPKESYPAGKIKEIDALLGKMAVAEKLEADYTAAIAKGDSLLGNKAYQPAKGAYQAALTLKPKEAYPASKITEIDALLAERARLQTINQQYDDAISYGDQLFAGSQWAQAKESYQQALSLKPEEPYPAQQLVEVDRKLEEIAQLNALNRQYQETMASAEKLFKAASYDSARIAFVAALALKPAEALPGQRIAEIDNILASLADQKVLDERYAGLIAASDKLMADKDYQGARAGYSQSLGLKPAESYPASKVKEIDGILAEMARIATLERQYSQAVVRGDSLMSADMLNPAKTEFETAVGLKPEEQYPRQKITEITALLKEKADQMALLAKYNEEIEGADKLFEAQSWDTAIAGYRKALELKPSEQYPADKIREIDSIKLEIARLAALDQEYQKRITAGERQFIATSYDSARTTFTAAQSLKPAESLPGLRIAQIDSILVVLAAQRALDEQYAGLIASSDKLLADKNYQGARTGYAQALDLKPAENYPAGRVKEINAILAENARISALDLQYNQTIRRGDSLFTLNRLPEAKTEFETASGLKPAESYPREKIKEVNEVLAELQGRRQTFDNLVLKGDQFFNGREYFKAKENFQQALELFPDEEHPKEKLRIANVKIDSIYRANKADYDKAVGEGDGFFNTYEYDKAIDAFTRAISFLPNEDYPRQMIAKIRKTIAENAIADVLSTTVIIKEGEERKFPFDPVNISSRRNNFIYLKVKNLSDNSFNILMRYGKGDQTSGGLAIRNITTNGEINERLISVKDQDPWYREDNNWISLYPQGGDIEVSFIQVSRAIN